MAILAKEMPVSSATLLQSPLKDFRSPSRQLKVIQNDYNRKGLVSEFGDRKQAFYILQEWHRKLEQGYK